MDPHTRVGYDCTMGDVEIEQERRKECRMNYAKNIIAFIILVV